MRSFGVTSEFISRGYVPNSQTVKRFMIYREVNVAAFSVCFKQLPLNIKQKFEFLYPFSVNKPADFHDTSFSGSLSLIKV